jgi:hypothetical protein
MSMPFHARCGSAGNAVADARTIANAAGPAGGCFTDGVNLYRCLGAIADGMGQMVGLENCRSLDVMLLPIGELRPRGMRSVIPAGDE